MKTPTTRTGFLMTATLASALLAACTPLQAPEGSSGLREKLIRLQTNQELASRAPVAVKEAETAVRLAETPEKDDELVKHRLLMADYRIEIATARGQARLYQDQRAALTREGDSARLDSRTREADRAQREADSAQRQALAARDEADTARRETEELKRQLAELEGKETERGIVITLGDVLFATGKSVIADNATGHLGKLADFLKEYPDRSVIIEGHTDSVGSESANIRLSQNRADAVRTFLIDQGVAGRQLRTVAMGQSSPVASNASATGRQQNRRVEIIIEKDNMAAR